MRTSITRRYRFSASHRLHIAQLSEEENTRLYGKCNNPFGHGHNYVLEITAEGPVDGESGLVLRLSELDSLMEERILRVFSDRNINLDIPQFRQLVPTTENISMVISELVSEHWESYISGASRLTRIHVQETDRNGFEIRVASEAANVDSQRKEEKVVV